MKHLETGSDKIKKICDTLRHETLEPAKQQARLILEQASDQAAAILQEARSQAELILENGKKMHEKERLIFEASMAQAAKIFKEKLRLEIENRFLSKSLEEVTTQLFNEPALVAQIVSALIEGLKSKGQNGDFTLILSAHLDKDLFIEALASAVKGQIGRVESTQMEQGVIVKCEGDDLRIDVNQSQMTQSLMEALRLDFRKFFYAGV